MTEAIYLRKATLMTREYKVVKDVVVPRNVDWPMYIRSEGRVYTVYPMARPMTIEATQQADREQLYMELDVYDV